MKPDLQETGIGQSPGAPVREQTVRTPTQTQLRSSEIQAFQAGQVVNLTSSCNSTSQWTANNTNMPEQQRMPERG